MYDWRFVDPGRNLLVVDEGETNFLFPFDFFSLPFFVVLKRTEKVKFFSFRENV